MSFKKFPNYMYEIVNTGGTVELGNYTIPLDSEASNLYLAMIFYRTDLFTTEQVRLRLERSDFPAIPIFSDWVRPNQVIGNFLESQHWIGNLRFTMNREQLNASTTYDLFLETQNYTHDSGGTQIGSILNFIDPATGAFDVRLTTGAYNTTFSYS